MQTNAGYRSKITWVRDYSKSCKWNFLPTVPKYVLYESLYLTKCITVKCFNCICKMINWHACFSRWVWALLLHSFIYDKIMLKLFDKDFKKKEFKEMMTCTWDNRLCNGRKSKKLRKGINWLWRCHRIKRPWQRFWAWSRDKPVVMIME